jgi:DNA-binding CsgD family transcriptional regulator
MFVSDADHRGGLALIAETAVSRNRRDFVRAVLPAAHRLFTCDEVSYSRFELGSSTRGIDFAGFPTQPMQVPRAELALLRRPGDHPVLNGWILAGRTGAVRLSDLHSRGELDRMPFFQEFFVPRRLRFAAYVVLDQSPTHVAALGLGRRGRDFTDAERDAFEHVRIPLAAVWRLVARPSRPAETAAADGRVDLTPAEGQVVSLVLRGLRNSAIAAELRVSTKAVEQHLTHVYRKYGVTSRTALVLAHIGSVSEARVSPIAVPPAGE